MSDPSLTLPQLPPGEDLGRRTELSPHVVAERYEVRDQLGRGGMGQVFRARDVLLDREVALKLIRKTDVDSTARIRREVAALRALRIPGTAQLFDEGDDGVCHFIAMELVDGTAFPGMPVPIPWPSLEPLAMSLLRALSQIHAAGYVHRDLKPGNVLVGDGKVTILDFGLVMPTSNESPVTQQGAILGTPAYIAPEQVTADPVDARADVFSVAVMLYQALSGRLPFDGPTLRSQLMARLGHPARPILELVAGLPPSVADALDSALARRPDDRPGSAAELLRRLSGGQMRAEPDFPWLGGEARWAGPLGAIGRGRPLHIRAPRGAGKTRLLSELEARIHSGGRSVRRVNVVERPFGGLSHWSDVESVLADRERPLDETTGCVRRAIESFLQSDGVVIADDWHLVDAWTRGVLTEFGTHPGLVTASHEQDDLPAFLLDALAPNDLRALFAGPSRLIHLPEDAARELHGRTGGIARRVVDMCADWVRSGHARWEASEGARCLRVDRGSLERLQGMRLALTIDRSEPEELARLPAGLRTTLAWIARGEGLLDVERVARVTDLPRWRAEAEVGELLARGLVERDGGGLLHAVYADSAARLVSVGVRSEFHRRLAEAISSPVQRLFHLTLAGQNEQAVDVAVDAAREALGRGDVTRADGLLVDGLSALRALGSAPSEQAERLLAEVVRVALRANTSSALDMARYRHACISAHRDEPWYVAQAMLLEAAVVVRGADGKRGLGLASAVPKFAQLDLDAARIGLRIFAAQGLGQATLAAVVHEAAAWAQARGGAAEAYLKGWRGRLAYDKGRYGDAALDHEAASVLHEDPLQRLTALTHAASAWLEAFEADRAEAIAVAAAESAARLRHVQLEARALWIQRTAIFRRGETLTDDPEYREALAVAGVGQLEGLALLTEAAAARREGRVDDAIRDATRGAEVMEQTGPPWCVHMCRALVAAVGGEVHSDLAARLDEVATCGIRGVAVQFFALLVRLDWPERGRCRELLAAAVAQFPKADEAYCMDVMSALECRLEFERTRELGEDAE